MYFSSITQVNLETLGKTIASTDEDLGIAPSAPMIEMIGTYHDEIVLFSIINICFRQCTVAARNISHLHKFHSHIKNSSSGFMEL